MQMPCNIMLYQVSTGVLLGLKDLGIINTNAFLVLQTTEDIKRKCIKHDSSLDKYVSTQKYLTAEIICFIVIAF